MDLLLVRHGEDSYNTVENIDKSLSEIGVRRARALGRLLKNKGVDVIFTSPMKRAYETAMIISAITGIKVIVSDELVERKTSTDTNLVKFGGSDDQMETHSDMMFRATRMLIKLKEYEDSKIILISHNEILNVLLHEMLQIGFESFPMFNLEPCSITKIKVSNFRATKVEYVNSIKYIQYLDPGDSLVNIYK